MNLGEIVRVRLRRSLELQWVPFTPPPRRALWTLDIAITRIDTQVAATPHITGLCLYLMSLEKIKTTGGVRNRLVQLAQKNKISGVPKDTPDGFAYNGIQKGGSQLQEQEQAAPECGKQQVEEEI